MDARIHVSDLRARDFVFHPGSLRPHRIVAARCDLNHPGEFVVHTVKGAFRVYPDDPTVSIVAKPFNERGGALFRPDVTLIDEMVEEV